jgi:polyisoprenoid-binding protein YceI
MRHAGLAVCAKQPYLPSYSPDFFNSAQFPTATFKSTSISKATDGTWNVSGDFTLRGATKPVTAKVALVGSGKDPMGKTLGGVEAKLTITRHDFGVSFMKGALGDDIEITIALEGNLQ